MGNENYLIHNLVDDELVLRARNVNSSNTFCVIVDNNSAFNYTLHVVSQNETHVTCERIEVCSHVCLTCFSFYCSVLVSYCSSMSYSLK